MLKETYMKIIYFISNAVIEQPRTEGKKPQSVKVADFDFIDNISVACHYYQNWTDNYRN
jgi:hypothetical protein